MGPKSALGLLNVPLIVDLIKLRDERQVSVDTNLLRVNSKRISYDYQPGQNVLKKDMNGLNAVNVGTALIQ